MLQQITGDKMLQAGSRGRMGLNNHEVEMSLSLLPRIERFLARPWNEKRKVLSGRLIREWNRALSKVPVPIVKRLEPGFLWIVADDVIREAILNGSFEQAERDFVKRFLQPGMTVLDVGAYHGLYTLTASLRVGKNGQVVAFEPSELQAKRLRRHLRLNRCKNVRTEKFALSSMEGDGDFFQVVGGAAGCSSLRSPNVSSRVRPMRVPVVTLDSYLQRNPLLHPIDFIKADVEGGELELFKGATNLLQQKIRPVILSELQDIRTHPWGYKANETAEFLEQYGFQWFRSAPNGGWVRLQERERQFDGNYIAVPEERMGQVMGGNSA